MIAVTPMSLLAALFGMSLVGLIEPKLHVEFGISPLDWEAETSSDLSITCAISDDTVNSGSMSNYDIQRCLIYKIDEIGWTALAAISKAESTHVLLGNSKIIKAARSIVESLNGSFIRLTWNRSDKEVYRKFRCDVEWKEYQDQSKKFSDLKISSEDKIKINSMWKASVEMLLTTELEQTIEDAIIIKMDEKVENVNNQTPEINGGDVTANVAGVENADVKLKNKISHYDKDQFFQAKQNIGSILLKSHYTKRSLLSIQDDNEALSENYLNNIKKTLNRQIIENLVRNTVELYLMSIWRALYWKYYITIPQITKIKC
ncbi:hypothetical protein Bpfe_017209 [Biomphalaria pfeifferi]|uniref:Uncharacterized protein n=1 Tax=Biomphalaria pfeifferi TaxID=112525 RepID=A0AAD8BEU0_BIOPF|nr:hypothetical protein Bpfe_017209 [Biomphalaria pfeifferi]